METAIEIKVNVCDECDGSGFRATTGDGADVEAFCTRCPKGLKLLMEDNQYHEGNPYYPYFTKEKFEKAHGVKINSDGTIIMID